MVGPTGLLFVPGVSLWQQLDPVNRTRLTMALLAFVLLFVAVIAFIMISARRVRREIRKPLPPVRDLTDGWASKPLSGGQNPSAGLSGNDEPGPSDETGSP